MKAFLLLLSVIASSALPSQSRMYTIGMVATLPPFSYLDPINGDFVGIGIDAARAVCQYAGINCRVVLVQPTCVIRFIC